MANCNCCVFNNAVAIDTSDPCVCNAAIGTTLVTSAGVIYVRTTQTNPCAVGDWAAINNNVGGFSITDAFANTEIVNTNDVITFLGQNGITATVSATDTVTIDGLTTFGIVAPVAAPAVPTQVNIYYDCAANQIYLWCPNTLTWNNPAPAQTPLTVVDTNSINLTASGTDNHTLQADAIIAPTQGGIANALSTIAGQGLYVPDPTDYLVINDLLDVDTVTTPPVAGDVLSFDGTNWVPVAQFSCEMVQDCMQTALTFAVYNDVGNTFALGSIDFHSDVDTTTTAPVVNQVLAWNGTNWIPANATAAFTCASLNGCSIDSLADVDTTTTAPVSGDLLTFNGTNWVPLNSAALCELVQDCMSTALPFTTYNDGLGTFTLGSVNFHSDVDTATVAPVVGQVLAWDGTNWVPTNATAAFACANLNTCSITALVDVDTTTNPPVTNQPLMWDGTNWTPIDATCPAPSDAQVFLGFNGTSYGWFNAKQRITPTRNVFADDVLVPATDRIVFISTFFNPNITFTLIPPAACDPQDFYIKRTDQGVANTVTIAVPAGHTIENFFQTIPLNTPGPFTTTAGEAMHIVYSGGNSWFIL